MTAAGAGNEGRVVVLRSRAAQAVTLAYVAVGLWYLWWRTLHTVNVDALWLSLPLLFADYLGFSFFLLFAMNLWSRVRRYPAEAPPGLSVDVFIATYNEPLEVLRPTVASALAMDYPHQTYVLDDGRRAEVEALCRELGAEYLTRPDNRGAKAGNINAALSKTNGDFIAIFDADHAPYRNFLTEMLGYFRDPKVALAQAPQGYYNLDSFQHGRHHRSSDGAPWHEQSVFYDAIMPGKDRWNAAFWCGSTAIVRRAALEEVGGIDTRTVTEDMHTSMSIHARGWKSVYHDRELALGIAPDDLGPFLIQRLRWAEGAMQIVRIDNPLLKRGLSLRQRISYFTSVVYVTEYLPKAVYLVTPPIALATGVLPMDNMGWNLLWRFTPYYLLGLLASAMLTGRSNPYVQSERYHLMKLAIMLRALTSLVVPRKLKFQVTPKGAGPDRRLRELGLIRLQVVLGALSLAAAAWGLAGAITGAPWALTGPSLLLTCGWALLNAGLVALVVRAVLRRHHRRGVYRFVVDAALLVRDGAEAEIGRATNISATGLGWMASRDYAVGDQVEVELSWGEAGHFASRVAIASCRPADGGWRVGAHFLDLDPAAERDLVLFLYQQVAPQSLRAGESEAGEPIPMPRRRWLKAS